MSQVVMMRETAGIYELIVTYNERIYRIIVRQMTTGKIKTFDYHATYEPRFGIDVGDQQWILAHAENLCQQFEEEDGKESNDV